MTHKKLKYLRQILGLTQEEICQLGGYTQGAYSKLETGRLKVKPIDEHKLLPIFEKRRKREIEQLKEEIKFLESLF